MTSEQYCNKCNAPHKPPEAVLMRCGTCAVVNGKLPPTKYQPIEAAIARAEGTCKATGEQI